MELENMGMGQQVTFTTTYFKPVAGEEEDTNPGRFGKALAQWLADRLNEHGVAVKGIIPDDFGWVVLVSRKPFMLWLGCGNSEGSTSKWSVFSVVEPSLFQSLFKRGDTREALKNLEAYLAELVSLIPEVSNVIWE